MKNIFALLVIVFSTLAYNSQAAESSSLQVDARKLYRGLLLKIQINGLPVFILNRRLNEIDALRKSHAESQEQVAQCPDCDSVLRSISPDYLVIWGYHPNSGCELIYVSSTAKDWVGHVVHGAGGFVDKCSGTEYDLSGRKLTGPDAFPDELEMPLHSFRDGILEINKMQTFKLNQSLSIPL